MIVTILNGNSIPNNKIFDDYLHGLADTLEMMSHDVHYHDLRVMKIKECRGCWDCWVKTPGKCAIDDDFQYLYSNIVNCDLLIFASPIKMGFVSSIIKKVNDRMIPLVLPFFSIINNEFHHKKRYTKYPKLGLILEKDFTTDDEDLKIIENVYEKTAINFHSELKFCHLIEDSEKELIHEINRI